MAIKHENYDPGLKYGATTTTDDVADGSITGVKLSTGEGFFVAAVNTAGTTGELSLFGTGGLGVTATIKGVWANSLDKTAVTVSLVNGQASVTTLVLGGVATTQFAGPFTLLTSVAVGATDNVFVAGSADAAYGCSVSFTIG